jgi:hypothetical protein
MTIIKFAFRLVILTALLLIPLHGVSAHRPAWGEDEGVTEIPNLRTSFAFYRELEPAPEGWSPAAFAGEEFDAAAAAPFVHLYAFHAQAGQNLYGGINIPAISGMEDYHVSLALIGPGLPQYSGPHLPLTLPDDDLGALVFESEISEDFYEPFTQTNYWGRQSIDMNLPATGEYYLVVWNPSGEAGKYVLDTGRAEEFSPGDIFRFPVWWVQVHLFFEHGPALVAGIGLITLLIGAVLWKKR